MKPNRIVDQEILNYILKVVTKTYQVKTEDLFKKTKMNDFVEPRHIILALGYSFTSNSQTVVGEVFGGADHAMINYATKKVLELYETNIKYKETLNKIIGAVNFFSVNQFSIQNIYNARDKKKSKVSTLPSLIDVFNYRMKELLTEVKTEEVLEHVKGLKAIYGVILSEDKAA